MSPEVGFLVFLLIGTPITLAIAGLLALYATHWGEK